VLHVDAHLDAGYLTRGEQHLLNMVGADPDRLRRLAVAHLSSHRIGAYDCTNYLTASAHLDLLKEVVWIRPPVSTESRPLHDYLLETLQGLDEATFMRLRAASSAGGVGAFIWQGVTFRVPLGGVRVRQPVGAGWLFTAVGRRGGAWAAAARPSRRLLWNACGPAACWPVVILWRP